MSYTVVIPARYQSTRLPGKPLALIDERPMIQHVHERASHSQASRVIVATDDDRISAVVKSFGGDALLTRDDHVSGTDRIQEVASSLGLNESDIVVNVQGDEPLIPVAVIDQVADNLRRRPDIGMATLCTRITTAQELFDPNAVKVVMDSEGRALYFSRAPIPYHRDTFASGETVLPEDTEYYRHLGIYAYRVGILNRYPGWPQSSAEQAESLEQLRALDQGVSIHCELAVETVPAGVDTAEDLAAIQARFRKE
jgi:3-deoxy-manno-octulosonate cytidylyltransferase (CMP-KDO synthetase)